MEKIFDNPYNKAMNGIREKMALQSIRKVIRDGNINDTAKLNIIMAIVHDFEEDKEQAELVEERRAIEADEAELRRARIDDMFENMTEPLEKLTIRKGGKE